MSSFIVPEETKFIRSYYELLCNDTNRLASLHSPKYKCLVVKENNDQFRHTSIKAGISRPVFKVFISNLSHQEVGELSLINVVGQFVYSDKTQQRVTHQFLVNSSKRIVSEMLVLLDEEIIYDWYENRITISNPKKELHEAVQDVSKFCLVESVENKGNVFVMKINKQNVSYEELRGKIETEGYKFEKVV